MDNYKIFTVLLAILSVVLFFSTVYYATNQKVEYITVEKSDTVEIHTIDTLTVTNKDIEYRDVIVLDTIYIEDTALVVEQKTYQDTISTVYFQGINAFIDSIEYRIPRDTVQIEIEKIQTVKEKDNFWKNRFNISAGVFAGYGLVHRQPDVFLGVGCAIRLY